MTDLVPRSDIEQIVGCPRHPREHRARAVSAEQKVYILHSAGCLDKQDAGVRDMRSCPYSLALDEGLDLDEWSDSQDVAVAVTIDPWSGLVPLGTPSPVVSIAADTSQFDRTMAEAVALIAEMLTALNPVLVRLHWAARRHRVRIVTRRKQRARRR